MSAHKDNQYLRMMSDEERKDWERSAFVEQPENLNVGVLNFIVKVLREELYWKRLENQELRTAINKLKKHT